MNTIIVDKSVDLDMFTDMFTDIELPFPNTCKDFVFNDFKILWEEWELKMIVHLEDGTNKGKYYSRSSNGNIYAGKWDFHRNIFNDSEINLDYENSDFFNKVIDMQESILLTENYSKFPQWCDLIEEQQKFAIGSEIMSIMRLCNYIMSAKREKVIKKKGNVKVNKTESKNTVFNNQKKVYLLKEIIEYVKDDNFQTENKTTHKINCDCWGVRGHYRHYKSGKVVFVREYKKGKNRDKKEPQGKTYTV